MFTPVDASAWRQAFVDALYTRLSDALENFQPEFLAARAIQATYRGWRVRALLGELAAAATDIQRLARGALARREAAARRAARAAARGTARAVFAACLIQRVWRGHSSRVNVHDFYARKRYLADVAARGEALRAQLEATLASQLSRAAAEEEAKALADFDRLTQNLHHLLSTERTPGVYNPPFAAANGELPSAFNVPMEEHLRVGALRYLRTRGLRGVGTGAVPGAPAALVGGTSRPQDAAPSFVAGDGSKLSLQATAPYDAVTRAKREEKRLSRLRQLDAKPFFAGGKTKILEPPPPTSVMVGTQYREPWLDARTSREAPEKDDEAKRVSGLPFVTTYYSKAGRLFEDIERERVVVTKAVLGASKAGATVAAAMAGGGSSFVPTRAATAASATVPALAALTAARGGTVDAPPFPRPDPFEGVVQPAGYVEPVPHDEEDEEGEDEAPRHADAGARSAAASQGAAPPATASMRSAGVGALAGLYIPAATPATPASSTLRGMTAAAAAAAGVRITAPVPPRHMPLGEYNHALQARGLLPVPAPVLPSGASGGTLARTSLRRGVGGGALGLASQRRGGPLDAPASSVAAPSTLALSSSYPFTATPGTGASIASASSGAGGGGGAGRRHAAAAASAVAVAAANEATASSGGSEEEAGLLAGLGSRTSSLGDGSMPTLVSGPSASLTGGGSAASGRVAASGALSASTSQIEAGDDGDYEFKEDDVIAGGLLAPQPKAAARLVPVKPAPRGAEAGAAEGVVMPRRALAVGAAGRRVLQQ